MPRARRKYVFARTDGRYNSGQSRKMRASTHISCEGANDDTLGSSDDFSVHLLCRFVTDAKTTPVKNLFDYIREWTNKRF